MNNKKGAQLAIGTIIMIILGLVVLVVVIYGFTVGWGNVTDKLFGITGGDVNVQSVIQSCELSCSIGSSYDFCTRERDVVFEEGGDSEKMTCRTLSFKGIGLDTCDKVSCPGGGHICIDRWGGEIVSRGDCDTSKKGIITFPDLNPQGNLCCVEKRPCLQWKASWKTECNTEGNTGTELIGSNQVSDLDTRPNQKCCMKRHQ